PWNAAARFHEYRTSLEVNLSPFENVTSWRSLNVYVKPSDDAVGTSVAKSGTMFRSLSNLTRPSWKFCWISWSVSASAMAGSSVPKSPRIGKLRVWSEARLPPPPPPPFPPQATSARLPTAPMARAFRIRNEVGAIELPPVKRVPLPPAFFPVHLR